MSIESRLSRVEALAERLSEAASAREREAEDIRRLSKAFRAQHAEQKRLKKSEREANQKQDFERGQIAEGLAALRKEFETCREEYRLRIWQLETQAAVLQASLRRIDGADGGGAQGGSVQGLRGDRNREEAKAARDRSAAAARAHERAALKRKLALQKPAMERNESPLQGGPEAALAAFRGRGGHRHSIGQGGAFR
jgi:hypothetical protein